MTRMHVNHHSTSFRCGSIYLTTLGISVLVMVIGLGAVALGRIQLRTCATANDFAEARLCARSGLELGMFAVYNDPYWRTNRGNGTWFTSKAIGNGTFDLTASDPIDSDITRGDNDPVILTATGKKGSARYSTSMRMEVSPRVGSCLEVSLCSDGDMTINAATLTSDQTISTNGQMNAQNSAVVNAVVEAAKSVHGTGYTKTTKVTGVKRTMPDPLHALDYYLANGTVINYTSLPQFQPTELITNNKFELDTSGWYAIGNCTVKQSTTIYKEGLASLRATARKTVSDVAGTDLSPTEFVPGHTYNVKFPVYCAAQADMAVAIALTTTTGTYITSTDTITVLSQTWTNLNLPLQPTWTGTITKATLTVTCSVNKDYYLDAVSFMDATYTNGTYVLEGRLLTPKINPFGAANDPNGIYVLNCNGKNVCIANSRIIGTLVLVKPGNNSEIYGSVLMEPALANFPVLLSDGQLQISLSSTALSESTFGINFNPAGAPYPYMAGTGTGVDVDTTDQYPSALNGLVYSKDDLTIDTASTVNGVVISEGRTTVNPTSLTLKYNSIYLNNPPPGFIIGTIQMTPVPGTWKRERLP